MTIGPSTVGSSSLTVTASSKSNSDVASPPGAGGWASGSSLSIGVTSQRGVPRKRGTSMAASAETARSRRAASQAGVVVALANGALHLELDEAVHLDRGPHRPRREPRRRGGGDRWLRGPLPRPPPGHWGEERPLAGLSCRSAGGRADAVPPAT